MFSILFSLCGLVNLKDCGLTLLQSYVFELTLEILKVQLLHWSELNNWLLWRKRPSLRSEREDKYPHMLLILGWWRLVLFEPIYSTQTNAITEKYSGFSEGLVKQIKLTLSCLLWNPRSLDLFKSIDQCLREELHLEYLFMLSLEKVYFMIFRCFEDA